MRNDISSILQSPIITEKTAKMNEEGKYAFKVCAKATKTSIAKAFKVLFDKDIETVNILNISGKKKVFKGRMGSRKDYKKAIVSLKKGDKLEFMS